MQKNFRKVRTLVYDNAVSSFCLDYSFWRNKKCFDIADNYTIARTCKKTVGNETDELCTTAIDQFGNKTSEKFFYCEQSKTCIPYAYTCDGAVNCIHAEDESFELCNKFFPEGATIKCKEANRTHYNISIYATPCDGIMECKDGEDELG